MKITRSYKPELQQYSCFTHFGVEVMLISKSSLAETTVSRESYTE